MGKLINPELTEDRTLRVELVWHGEGKGLDGNLRWDGKCYFYYFDSTNLLTDGEAAFGLLHLLHHLNGATFREPSHSLFRLNPAIVRMLNRHHRALGSAYRLFFDTYDAENRFDALQQVLLPLLPTRSRGCNTGVASETRFIRTDKLQFNLLGPENMHRLKEIISTVGNHCWKLCLTIKKCSNQHFNELLKVNSV